MKSNHRSWRRRVRWLPLLAAAPLAVAAESPDPTDPGAIVPPVGYEGVVPEGARGYLDATDVPRLPWPRLFAPDGTFVPEARLGGAGSAQAAGGAGDPPATGHGTHRDHAPGHEMRHGAAPAREMRHGAQPASAAGASDARAVVKSVDREQGKVKLKHGPIERLEMPGMTMIFRVRDPSLLDGVKEGDEVGITVEIQGTTFVVTGFQP